MATLTDEQIRNIVRNKHVMHEMLSQPCEDCKLTWHPLVMTFDHEDRSKKGFTISGSAIFSPVLFDRELAKCVVVCRNCHQIREYLRDLGTIKISEKKRARYNYYAALVPYLTNGALLRNTAFSLVRLKRFSSW